MIYSMTAFASGRCETEYGQLALELRSLNHRYLELALRLPDDLRAAEPMVREGLGNHLQRGKVDCNIKLKRRPGTGGVELALNMQLASQLEKLAAELSATMTTATPASIAEWLRWPGVVEELEPDLAPLHDALAELLNTTIVELVGFRGREGQRLKTMIEDRLIAVEGLTAQVREWLPEIRLAMRARLDEKMAAVSQRVDPDRLEQELAILLQKMDIDEELDRLGAHLAEVRHTLELDKPVGRRLDFLMQELHREANTLGSKSVDARTTQVSVDLKVLIEQMREQVQNIE
jgi:uncharacterized protein (TIGR00255 family)